MKLFAATDHRNLSTIFTAHAKAVNQLWTDHIVEKIMMRSIMSCRGLKTGRGYTVRVCRQWTYNMHDRAAVTRMTNVKHETNEQHIEQGTSRSKSEFKDQSNIQECFNHRPFIWRNKDHILCCLA